MKQKILAFAVIVFCALILNRALADEVHIKPPRYMFFSATVRNPQIMEFDSLNAAFSEVQAYYASLNNHTATYVASGLHGTPALVWNGIPQKYFWILTVTTSDGEVRTEETGNIGMYPTCDQDPQSGNGLAPWVPGGNGNDTYWCERKEPAKPEINNRDTCNKETYTPNPIVIPTSEKLRIETDYTDHAPHPLTFRRIYLSGHAKDFRIHRGGFGYAWRHSFHGVAKKINNNLVKIDLPDGSRKTVVRDTYPSAGAWRVVDSLDTIAETDYGWKYKEHKTETVHWFEEDAPDADAKFISSSQGVNGFRYTYSYSAGRLSFVRNAFDRMLTFDYDSSDRVIKITGPDQRFVQYNWSGDNYSTQYADGLDRSYIHGANQGRLLTAMDISGQRWANFTYDEQGRVMKSELAGGVERYQVSSELSDGSISALLIDPFNNYHYFGYKYSKGQLVLTASPSPGIAGETAIKQRSVNDVGLPTESVLFSGTKTQYAWNSRSLPTAITEAAGEPEERTTQTTWHPQWRLPLTISESGRTTTYTYDNQGNRLSETITDTGGGSGSSGIARTTTWTYHPSGLVATETAPNGAVTSYQYDSAGNLTSSTNALGHVDTYTHDGAGRVLSHTAPTGLVTSYTYDPRGRMLTTNRGGQLTTLTYRPSGQVASATLPHGHSISYTYDAAQRLTGWSDNRGNSGAYTLDAMGNRTREDLRNAQGQLVWRLARTINSLNRVQTVTLGNNQTTTYGYDSNGDWVATTNSLGQSTSQSLDALRRTKAITNAESATASLSYNALDSITQATDYKGVATTYARDAQGNATTETSPDSGTETAQYGALGLPSTITDALGQATTIERDLLGRPTLITHAAGRTTSLRYDLTATSKGTLGEIVDASGTTTYQRDAHGRVTTKTQHLINGDTRSISYAYNAQGLLASTTYPGGQVLQHVYDTTGQITGLTWAGQPLVSGITWNPLGQPTGWSWNLPGAAAAIPATRSYNTAGQLTTTEFSSYQYDAAGRIQTLTQKLWRPANTNPQASTISQATSTWTVQYSPAGRITGFTKTTAANAPVDTATFQYDTNGNRTTSTRDIAGTNTSRSYGGDASHNRLLGFEQTTASTSGTSATTSVSYQYNAAGDLTHDGLRSYAYDSQGRLESATTGQGADAPTTKYAHNALGQRVFKTEPLYSSAQSSGSNKNLNNLLADDEEPAGSNAEQGFMQQLVNFFSKLWSPSTSDAEKLGWSYVYAEDGSLLGEYGQGSAVTSGTAQYIWLPTANGPMPIAAIIDGRHYAVHSDHLNTPRKLTQADGQVAWQWAYSAFGDEQPTTAAKRFTSETTNPTTGSTSTPEVTFNLRYPGQYFDKETNLHYNYFRTYAPGTGRYTQFDPIGLAGGWNRGIYAEANPLSFADPTGLASFMEGGQPWESPLIDNGSSCSPILPSPRVDDGGCISTGGGPSICLGPGSIKGASPLSGLTKEQLKALIGPDQTQLLRNLFGSGINGANNSINNLSRPAGLTDQALAAYKELAIRAINSYEQSGNAAGAAVQRLRLEILNRLGK